MSEFTAVFQHLAGESRLPHDWQRELAAEETPRSRLIRIPTGMGKTLGVLASWFWHRVERRDARWPRRLVWCLPMRVLVEQTEEVIRECLDRYGVLWDGRAEHGGRVGVHLLMGGSDAGGDWHLYPEDAAVLIGTQDMLLSRALNRGYASGRARWPLDFGLLSHDALWVMDEVQLMDVGLATSAQLQAFHEQDAGKGLHPRCTWWMSATLQSAWLESVDTAACHVGWGQAPVVIAPSQRGRGLGAIRKSLSLESIGAQQRNAFAERVLEAHGRLADGEHGRITLVICNTVERACETFDALRTMAPEPAIELVHSRFRPSERTAWRSRFLSRAACQSGANRIIVATQVVEAGVDISAGCVVTELAPWPSLVQRFGRCARYGGSGAIHVVDRGRDEPIALPYTTDELEAAREALERLASTTGDAGIGTLEAFEHDLDAAARARLYPYRPRHLLLRQELDELFDTTPDLTGADIDISRFIRSGEERDVLVFWPPSGGGAVAAPPRYRPRRDELCAVPFLRARDWLCGVETKSNRKPRLRPGVSAWVWDWIDGVWRVAKRADIRPGRVVCVAATCGGYDVERGFDPRSTAQVAPVPTPPVPGSEEGDDFEDSEDLSVAAWKTVACHGSEVAALAARLAAALDLPTELRRVLTLAGRWHDLGKAHPAFQGAIRGSGRPARDDLAKAPDAAWLRPPGTYRTADDRDERRGFRHELASALALFAVLARHQPEHPALLGPWIEALELTSQRQRSADGREPPTPCEDDVLACTADEFDLLAYLVACHHGKVRVALHAGPKDQDYRDPGDGRGLPIRGVREGDVLPSVRVDAQKAPLPPLRLTLEPASIGLSAQTGVSWRERTLRLLDRFGPGALAWLEALIIAADRRASRLATPDPALAARDEVQR